MMKMTINRLLEDIEGGLKVTDDPYKRQWLLGAQSALMCLDCDRETMQGVMWHNDINCIVGKS